MHHSATFEPTSRAPLIEAHGMSVARGRRTVVHDVELSLHPGQVTALLGPNGAGKSTLLAALAGALAPSAGAVIRTGRVATALQSPDLARRPVLANVTVALSWWGVPRAQRRERARDALAELGVGHLAGRAADELSGGERRRVHLARVIACRPDVLLLDEPFAGLDGEARATLIADAQRVLRAPERATLVVVHDRSEAWAIADRLLVLLDGRLLADGPPAGLLAAPPSAEVARFLGYDGELAGDGDRLLTRPAHVRLDPGGPIDAEVDRVIPTEDGARVELRTAGGRLVTLVDGPPPATGSHVRVRLTGGIRFPNA